MPPAARSRPTDMHFAPIGRTLIICAASDPPSTPPPPTHTTALLCCSVLVGLNQRPAKQPVHGRQDEAEKSATKSFDVREFLSKCLATRARAAAPAAPSAASAAVPWVAAATEDPPSTCAAPSVEGLLELLALVADECRDNSGDDVFSKAFLQRCQPVLSAFLCPPSPARNFHTSGPVPSNSTPLFSTRS